MKLLKDKILKDGYMLGKDILKVDSFINHQIDVNLLNEIGKEFKKRFANKEVTKILTIEASGIAIACIASQYFDNVPVVFAKKSESLNLDKEIYYSEVYSFTKKKSYKIMVSKKYLNKEDKVLIIDDFLANGRAIIGLKDIINQARAHLVGAGIVIEKGFQEGGKILRRDGIDIQSLAIIDYIDEGNIGFE